MTEFYITEDFPKNEVEFGKRFATESACFEYLFKIKWPDGFICSKCAHRFYWISCKHIYICTRCESHFSLTADTIMHDTKKPITYWFRAMWWFTTRKSGVNAINLQDLLGCSYVTAWSWLQKLRRCTIRKDREKLAGKVEVDEFFIGGQKPGKRGRGSDGKSIIVAAVERKGRKIGRIRLQVIDDCSSESLTPFIEQNVEEGSQVITDGWKGYDGLDQSRYDHHQVFLSKSADKYSALSGVHLIASLVKRLVIGTFQGRFEPKYLQNYLDEYVFRFNRRTSKSVGKKFMRIVQQVASSVKLTCRQIKMEISADLLLKINSLGLSI
jgi:transposase-like protein